MRKIVFVLMLISLSLFLVAQENDFQPFQMGIGAYSGMTVFEESYVQEGLWIAGILHITPRIAVRPQVLFLTINREQTDIDSDTTDKYEDTAFGAGLDFLYYWPLPNDIYFYAGPSVRYYKYIDKYEYNDGSSAEDITTDIRAGIKVGGQFMLSPSFGFFGDFGIGIESRKDEDKNWDAVGVLTDEDESSMFIISTMGARLGGIFYLN